MDAIADIHGVLPVNADIGLIGEQSMSEEGMAAGAGWRSGQRWMQEDVEERS